VDTAVSGGGLAVLAVAWRWPGGGGGSPVGPRRVPRGWSVWWPAASTGVVFRRARLLSAPQDRHAYKAT